MTRDLTAIVLAGGRSARFGSDKLAVAVSPASGGGSILDRAIAAVASIASEVVVVGREEHSWRAVPGATIRAVADPEQFGGPLQAVAGALSVVTTDLAIVVAGDMPAVVPAVLDLMIARLLGHLSPGDASTRDPAVDAVVLADPRDPSRRQPLPLAVRVAPARAAAAAALDAGDRSLVRMLARLAVAEVPVDRWLPLDPEGETLRDIDVPADLDRLRLGARDQRMR